MIYMGSSRLPHPDHPLPWPPRSYAQAGAALGLDLLNNPGLVSTNASVAFQTALWFWTAPQTPKPSCHDVMAGR